MSLLNKTIAWLVDNGWRGDRVPDEVFKQRITICESCPKFIQETRQCQWCECFMDVKAKLVIDPIASLRAGREKLAICADPSPRWGEYDNIN